MNYLPNQVWFFIILFSPSIGTWIFAYMTRGKYIWLGYWVGILVTIAIIYFHYVNGKFDGEQAVFYGIVLVFIVAPLSTVIGAISGWICKKTFKSKNDIP